MRFKLAGALAVAQILQRLEDEYPDDRCGPRCSNCQEALRSAINEQDDPERVPEPAVSHARRRNHPVADPPWRAPAVQAPHQTVIAALDKSPDGACDCHRSF